MTSLIPNPRQAGILATVRELGSASVEALADRFDVTLQTVRRDVKLLADAGLLARFHGGVRLPAIEVPVASYEGSNKFAGQGANFCFLLGSETSLTAAQLQTLYPTPDVLVQKTEAAARKAVAQGVLEPQDAAELVARTRNR